MLQTSSNVILGAGLLFFARVTPGLSCSTCFCNRTWEESELSVQVNISYGQAVNKYTNKMETLLLTLYQPPDSDPRTKRPAILTIHGGAFTHKDFGNDKNWAKHFASRGFVAASIDYRLEGRLNQTIGNLDAMYDAKAAVRWLVKHSARLRVDTDRISAFGASAGGMIVAYMTAVPGEGDSGNPGFPSNITAGISLSGYLQFSENKHITRNEPPYIDFHGTEDPLIPFHNAEGTNVAMDMKGAKDYLVPLFGEGHVPYQALEEHTSDVMGFLITHMNLAAAECPRKESGTFIV